MLIQLRITRNVLIAAYFYFSNTHSKPGMKIQSMHRVSPALGRVSAHWMCADLAVNTNPQLQGTITSAHLHYLCSKFLVAKLNKQANAPAFWVGWQTYSTHSPVQHPLVYVYWYVERNPKLHANSTHMPKHTHSYTHTNSLLCTFGN